MGLPANHRATQLVQLDAAADFFTDLADFAAMPGGGSGTGGTYARPRNVQPYTGLVHAEAETRDFLDPLGLQRLAHDVEPRELLDAADPHNVHRDGSARDLAQITAAMRAAFEGIASGGAALHQHMVIERPPGCHLPPELGAVQPMYVYIVNYVYTSYFSAGAAADGAPEAPLGAGGGGRRARPTVFSNVWMWRRLLHLGPEQNGKNTSMKVNYMAPFKGTHLIFDTARVLEVGAAHPRVSSILSTDGTLALLRAAGAHSLHRVERRPHNIVVTSDSPVRDFALNLDLLRWRLERQTIITVPREFPGIIVQHPQLASIKILFFPNNAVVIVGSASIEDTRAGMDLIYRLLVDNANTPSNALLCQQLVANGTIGPIRKHAGTVNARKRKRAQDQ